jgi:hypothetical protein
MIVIQIILVTGLTIALVWFIINPRSQQTHAWIKIATFFFAIFAIVVVISPNTSNVMARAVGVGRGADLLLYVLTLAFIFVVIHTYFKNREERDRYEKLARSFALLEANLTYRQGATESVVERRKPAQGR